MLLTVGVGASATFAIEALTVFISDRPSSRQAAHPNDPALSCVEDYSSTGHCDQNHKHAIPLRRCGSRWAPRRTGKPKFEKSTLAVKDTADALAVKGMAGSTRHPAEPSPNRPTPAAMPPSSSIDARPSGILRAPTPFFQDDDYFD
jgi:hypothetical protein